MNTDWVLYTPAQEGEFLVSTCWDCLHLWKLFILSQGQHNLVIQVEGALAPCVYSLGLEGGSLAPHALKSLGHMSLPTRHLWLYFPCFDNKDSKSWITNNSEAGIPHNSWDETRHHHCFIVCPGDATVYINVPMKGMDSPRTHITLKLHVNPQSKT